jgi:hypothetical protein
MSQRILAANCLVIVLSVFCTSFSEAADEPAQGGPPTLSDLSIEVAALQAFHDFKFTREQLATLRKFAKETAPEPAVREAGKGSADFRRTLTALREALVEDDDDDLIDQLQEEIDGLRDNEAPELDADFEVTDAARSYASKLLRLLSARQIACYLAAHAEEIPEPLERLLEALEKVRALDAKEWKELRAAVSAEVGQGVAGLDGDKAAQVSDQVVQLLIQARALKDDEFKEQRPELEKMAREIVGNLSPLDVLRNVLVQELAEILSNPRLPAAIDARFNNRAP